MHHFPAISRLLLLLGLLLSPGAGARAEGVAGPSRGLGSAGWPGPDDPSLKGVRLDRPRAGPGAVALHRLASCSGDESDSAVCVDQRFPGRELMIRELARRASEVSAGERPGLVRLTTEQLGDLTLKRVKRLQRPAMRSCGLVLDAVLRGRCDEVGVLAGMPLAEAGLSSEERGLLSPFLRKLPATGRKTVHRVVCGPFALGRAVRIDEALVVLGPGKRRPIEDLRCRIVPRPRSSEGESPSKTWKVAREGTEAVRALAVGLDCLDQGGGACQAMIAPLNLLELEAMNRGLDQRSPEKRAAWMENLRGKVLGPVQERRPWALSLAYEACPSLASLPTDIACVAGPARPAKLPPLVGGLKGGEAAQARALRAILKSTIDGLEPREAEVQCGSSSVKVTFATREDGTTALLGMRCTLPGDLPEPF